jgi:hypothetical protein
MSIFEALPPRNEDNQQHRAFILFVPLAQTLSCQAECMAARAALIIVAHIFLQDAYFFLRCQNLQDFFL